MLPSSERLRKAGLFQRVYSLRKSISSGIVTLYVVPREKKSAPQLPHVGFVIGKKVDKRSTVRNKAKRRIREAYRLIRQTETSIKQWYAIVWVINSNAINASWDDICDAVNDCIVKANQKFGDQKNKN